MGTSLQDALLLALMFGSGYLLSRILIKCGIAESLVFTFIRRSRGHISRIVVYIVLLSAVISMFIPNIITVLAILPLLEILKKDFEKIDTQDRSLTTALAIANLYGANIGGVGFILGSASNIVLVTFLFLNKIEGAGKLNFISWIGWGVPFVLVSSAIACLVIIFFLVPKKYRAMRLNFTSLHEHRNNPPHQRAAYILSAVFFVFWVALSAVHLLDKEHDVPYLLGIAIVYFIAFNVFSFFISLRDKKTGMKGRLLVAEDVVSNLPRKGFILAAATIVFAFLLLLLNIDQKIFDLMGVTSIPRILATQTRAVLIISVVLTTLTVFISEFMSNTATAVAFFTVAVALCGSLGVPALPILMGISVVSAMPSMSPIASPVNAMAFGGLRGVSLKRMMAVGAVMNLVAVGLVNVWALLYIPWYYRMPLR